MAKNKTGIILLALALCVASVGLKAGDAAPGNKEIIKNAVYITDGKVLPENEGKVVIVTGTLEAPLPFVDRETGVTIDTIVAHRYVEKAQVAEDLEDEKYVWTWNSTLSKADFGGTQKLIAPGVTIGEFAVADELMQQFPTLKQRTEYTAADCAAMGWNVFKDEAGVYLYQLDAMPSTDDEVYEDTGLGTEHLTSRQKNEGTLRVRYNVVSDSTGMDYTVIGTQKNGCLEDIDELKLNDIISGHLTVEELLEYADSHASKVRTTAFIIAAILAGLGVMQIVKNAKGGDSSGNGKSRQHA